MKHLISAIILTLTLSHLASAQVVEPVKHTTSRQQVTVQVSGVVTRKVTDSGLTYKPTSTGGALVGYRFNINRWLGVEGEYDFFRNSQKYSSTDTSYALRTNVHAATGAVVINIPNPLTKRIKSFASVGGGALLFDPRDTDLIQRQFKSTIVIGGGMDLPITRHIAFRAQAKTFLYKAPDFAVSGLATNKYVQTMVPSAGVVFNF